MIYLTKMGCQELVVELLPHFTHHAYNGYAEDAPNAEVNMLTSTTRVSNRLSDTLYTRTRLLATHRKYLNT